MDTMAWVAVGLGALLLALVALYGVGMLLVARSIDRSTRAMDERTKFLWEHLMALIEPRARELVEQWNAAAEETKRELDGRPEDNDQPLKLV